MTPTSIAERSAAKAVYDERMVEIQKNLPQLDELGVPREDSAMGLPLGMETRIVCKHNLRNLMDMSRQRMCSRAYHEYRALFSGLCRELSGYSEEWDYTVRSRQDLCANLFAGSG